jgi:hypothetical protein
MPDAPDLTRAEAIKASDLKSLMEVVSAAAGLWNACESSGWGVRPELWKDYMALGAALRQMGLPEAER